MRASLRKPAFLCVPRSSGEVDDEKDHEQDKQNVNGEHGDVESDEADEPSDEQNNGDCEPHA
jgi:hypothetical protein